MSERDVSDLGAPVGLAGPEDGEGPLWTADFIEDRLVTVPDGDVLCSLPDTGVRAVARVGGAALTLHASGLFRVVVEGCASERLATWESAGSDLAYEGGELLELDGREVRIRAPDTAAQQGRWALEDAPSELERLAVEDGLLLLPEPTSVAGGFHVVLHVFDAARGAASARAVARLELPIDASAVRGAYAAGDRLWLLTGGSGSQAARLVEVVLE